MSAVRMLLLPSSVAISVHASCSTLISGLISELRDVAASRALVLHCVAKGAQIAEQCAR